jgi:capsule polysaccharide modification protein KpsS
LRSQKQPRIDLKKLPQSLDLLLTEFNLICDYISSDRLRQSFLNIAQNAICYPQQVAIMLCVQLFSRFGLQSTKAIAL